MCFICSLHCPKIKSVFSTKRRKHLIHCSYYYIIGFIIQYCITDIKTQIYSPLILFFILFQYKLPIP
eukprot:UN00553